MINSGDFMLLLNDILLHKIPFYYEWVGTQGCLQALFTLVLIEYIIHVVDGPCLYILVNNIIYLLISVVIETTSGHIYV